MPGRRPYGRRVDYPGPEASFADRLRWAIEMRGLTQASLSRIVDVGTNRMNEWARGHAMPRAPYRAALAEALRADVGWLVTGQGLPWPEVLGPETRDPVLDRMARQLDELAQIRGEIKREDVLDLLREALARGADRRDEPGSGSPSAGRGRPA